MRPLGTLTGVGTGSGDDHGRPVRLPATLILFLLLCAAGCGEEGLPLSLVGAPVPLGTTVATVVASGDELLVVTTSGRSIRRVDLRSRTPVGQPISVPGGVSALAVEGDSIWVVDRSRETLRRLDGRTGRVSSPAIQVPYGSRPAIGFGRLWVFGLGELRALDPRTGRLDGLPVPLPPSSGRPGREIAVGEGAVWVADGALSRIDPRTRQVTRVRLSWPVQRVAAGAGAVWVTAAGVPGLALRVDPVTNRETAIVTAAGPEPPRPLSVEDFSGSTSFAPSVAVGEGSAWVATDRLHRIDPATNRIIGSPLYHGHRTAGDLAVTDHGIWVAGGADFLTGAVAEESNGPRTRPAGVLDERSGTYLGAGIGDTREVLRRSLGDARAFDPTARLAVGLRLPSSKPTLDPALDVAYDGFTLSFPRHPEEVPRVRQITVSVPGARTRRGLRVDDPLGWTRRSYPNATCHQPGVGGIAGGSITPEPFCLFGEADCVVLQAAGDPIHTLAAVDLTQPSGTPLPVPGDRRRRCARSARPR